MALKRVDSQMYSAYEEIVKKYNKMRSRIKKTFSVLKGESTGGRLPAMVIPQRHRKISERTALNMSRRALRMKMRALYSMVAKGEEGFFRDFKRSYIELYRNYIIEETPELRNGMYTSEQIKDMSVTDPDMAQFMHDYNALITMSPNRFITLLYTGKIPEFKWLYRELVQGISGYQSFAEQMHQAIRLKSVRGESEKDRDQALEHRLSNKKETQARINRTRRGIANHNLDEDE